MFQPTEDRRITAAGQTSMSTVLLGGSTASGRPFYSMLVFTILGSTLNDGGEGDEPVFYAEPAA